MWLSERPVRYICKLFGCRLSALVPNCIDCGADLYGDDFIRVGYLTPMLSRLQQIPPTLKRLFMGTICDQCGKRFWRGYDREICSAECFDKWIPF